MVDGHSSTNSSTNRKRMWQVAATAAAVAAVAGAAVAVAVQSSASTKAGVPAAAGTVSAAPSLSASVTPFELPTVSAPFTTDPNFFPPGNGPGIVAIDRAAVVSGAQKVAVDATGAPLSAAEQSALPTYSRLMNYSDSVLLVGDGPDPRIDPNRQVWVVSVEGYHQADSVPPGLKVNPVSFGYTFVTDATSGFLIEAVLGVAVLTS